MCSCTVVQWYICMIKQFYWYTVVQLYICTPVHFYCCTILQLYRPTVLPCGVAWCEGCLERDPDSSLVYHYGDLKLGGIGEEISVLITLTSVFGGRYGGRLTTWVGKLLVMGNWAQNVLMQDHPHCYFMDITSKPQLFTSIFFRSLLASTSLEKVNIPASSCLKEIFFKLICYSSEYFKYL